MIQRKHIDIFERLLQDMARIISEILGKRTSEHLVALQEAMEYYLQLNEEDLHDLKGKALISFLQSKNFEFRQLEVTAHFLSNIAKVLARDEGLQKAHLQLQQAIDILEFLEVHDEVYSQSRRDTLKELKEMTT